MQVECMYSLCSLPNTYLNSKAPSQEDKENQIGGKNKWPGMDKWQLIQQIKESWTLKLVIVKTKIRNLKLYQSRMKRDKRLKDWLKTV